jgi:hypothetical protein
LTWTQADVEIPFKLQEPQARQVLLTRALDQGDRDGKLVGRLERAQATRQALRHHRGELEPDLPLKAEPAQRFLIERAKNILGLLPKNDPLTVRTKKLSTWPGWLYVAVPLLALALGLAGNSLGAQSTINLLHFPLFGLILWNLIIYVFLLLRVIAGWFGIGKGRVDALRLRLFELLQKLRRGKKTDTPDNPDDADRQTLRSQISRDFAADWLQRGRALHASRIAAVLHLSAAALVAGMLGGLYIRGLALEYRVVWESTFLSAENLIQPFAIFFGPLALLGFEIPGAAEIREAARPGGVNAAGWIHLLAASAAFYVIIPRLILAGLTLARVWHLKKRFPLEAGETEYFRKLLQRPAPQEESGAVLVLPHSLALDETEQESLRLLFGDCFGSSMDVKFAEPVQYGFEEDVSENLREQGENTLYHVVSMLFRLTATPEAEVQGALMTTLQQESRQSRLTRRMVVLLDSSGFKERFGEGQTAQRRMAERRKAWDRLCEQQGLTPVTIDLSAEDPGMLGNVVEEVRQATWDPE